MSRNFFLLVLLQVILLVSIVHRGLVFESLSVLGSDLVSIFLGHDVVILFLVWGRGEVIELRLVHCRTFSWSTHPFTDPKLIVCQVLGQFLFQTIFQHGSIHINAICDIVFNKIVHLVLVIYICIVIGASVPVMHLILEHIEVLILQVWLFIEAALRA